MHPVSRTITYSAVFTALGVLIPVIFHGIGLGPVFLPMFWPAAAAGFFLGPAAAAGVGIISPLLSGLLTGMPPVPIVYKMVFELAFLAGTISLIRRHTRLNEYWTVICGAAAAAAAGILGSAALAPLLGLPKTFYAAANLVKSLPGYTALAVFLPLLIRRFSVLDTFGRAAPGHRDYFNGLAPVWDTLMEDDPALPAHLSRFGIPRGSAVLDLGAGTGRIVPYIDGLTGSEGTIVALDTAEKMLAAGKSRCRGYTSRVHWLCGDAEHLCLAAGSFDTIVCYSAFPHFRDKNKALHEMFRVLKPGGSMLILHSDSSKALNTFHAGLDKPVSGDRLPAAGQMPALLTAAGFRVQHTEEKDGLYWVEAAKPDR